MGVDLMATMPDDMTVTLKLDASALKDLYAQLAYLNKRVMSLEADAAHHAEEDAAISADAIRTERDKPQHQGIAATGELYAAWNAATSPPVDKLPCTCATMWTLRPGQQITTTCPRHGQVVHSNPMRVF